MTSDALVCVAASSDAHDERGVGGSAASAAVAALHAELAAEEAALRTIAEDVTLRATQLGCLHSEYKTNMERVLRYYEPELRPLRETTHAAAEQRQLVAMRVAWLEHAIATHAAHTSNNDNNNDNNIDNAATTTTTRQVTSLRAVGEAMLRDAHAALQRSYDALQSCPTHALRMLSEYTSPPDAAIATVQLVLRLRGERDCSWAAAQVMVSPNYLCHFFVSRSEALLRQHTLLPRTLLCALEAFFAQPAHAVDELYKCSEPIGCLGAWLHAMRHYYRVKLVTAPMFVLPSSPSSSSTHHAASASSNNNKSKDDARAAEQHALALLHELMYSSTRELAAAGAMTAPTDTSDDNDSNEQTTTSSNSNDDNNEQQQQQQQECAVDNKHNNDDDEERALVQHYTMLKARLQRHVEPQAALQAELRELRQRLHAIDDRVRAAEAAVSDVQQRMRANVRDVLHKYDTAMLSVHDELEQHTEAFVRAVTHDTTAHDDGDDAQHSNVTDVALRLLPSRRACHDNDNNDSDDIDATAGGGNAQATLLLHDNDMSAAWPRCGAADVHTPQHDALRLVVLIYCAHDGDDYCTQTCIGNKRAHDDDDASWPLRLPPSCVRARYLVCDTAAHVTPRWCAELQRVVSIAALLRTPCANAWSRDTAMLASSSSLSSYDKESCGSTGGDDDDDDGVESDETNSNSVRRGGGGAAHAVACRRVRTQQLRGFHVRLSPHMSPMHWRRDVDGVAGTHLHVVLYDTLDLSAAHTAASRRATAAAPVRVAALLNATLVANNSSNSNSNSDTQRNNNDDDDEDGDTTARRVALLVLHAPDTQLVTSSSSSSVHTHGHTAADACRDVALPRMTASLFAFAKRFTTRHVMPCLDLDVLQAWWPATSATATTTRVSDAHGGCGDGDACRLSGLGTSYYCRRVATTTTTATAQGQHACVRNVVFVVDVPTWAWAALHDDDSDSDTTPLCAHAGRQLARVMHDALLRLALKHPDVFGYHQHSKGNNNNSNTQRSASTAAAAATGRDDEAAATCAAVHYPRQLAVASIADSITRIVALSPNVTFVRDVERLLFARTSDAYAEAGARTSGTLCRYTAAAMQRAIEDKLRDDTR